MRSSKRPGSVRCVLAKDEMLREVNPLMATPELLTRYETAVYFTVEGSRIRVDQVWMNEDYFRGKNAPGN